MSIFSDLGRQSFARWYEGPRRQACQKSDGAKSSFPRTSSNRIELRGNPPHNPRSIQELFGIDARRRSPAQQHRGESHFRQIAADLRDAREDVGRVPMDVGSLERGAKCREHRHQVLDGAPEGLPALHQLLRGNEGGVD